jgi:anti-anti-sigma factor
VSSELQPEREGFAAPAIEIERTPSRAPSYAAIVSLRGEHDLDSSVAIRRALDSIDGDLLIDLSRCGFMDSSVIGTLLRTFQDRAGTGHRLELIVPPSNRIITRTIEIASLRELVTVHDALP